MIKYIKENRKYYRFLVFLILVGLAVVTRLSVYYFEQRKPIYNMERMYVEQGVPIEIMELKKTSEVFYAPLTLLKTSNDNYFTAYVGPELRQNLTQGGKVTLTFSGEQYFGKIDRISSVIDLDVGLYPVSVYIKSPRTPTKSFYEAFAEVSSVENAIVLPRDIVVYDSDNKPFVYVVDNNKAVKTYLTLGIVGQQKVSVVSGLKEGDVVIKSDSNNLKDGISVKLDKE